MRNLAALHRDAAVTAIRQTTPERQYISTGGEGASTAETMFVAIIVGFGDEPRNEANSSFLVFLVGDDLQPIGDQFEVYARIQSETGNHDLGLCSPHYDVGDFIEIREARFPINGTMVSGWFAEDTFQSTDCECD